MSSVDQRVVELKFNHGAFTKNIAEALASLTRLQDGLRLKGSTQGAAEAASGLDQLGQKTGFVGGQFTAMQAMAFGALASIGAKAVQVGQQVISSLTIDPVMQGFQEYETNMNSIQTILANTSAAGTGLPEVNAALDEMNHYSDKTIYNFSEMAKNVGTFTAAGVDLDTATGSIKGIANLAALSGSNSQQAAGAMYQLSQEIAAGKVTLMGWNSVVNAGMGGSVFQRALAETAVAMGKIDKSALTLEGDMKNVKISGESFRDSISAEGGGESWLTSDVLTNTLQQFTGDLNEAELAAQGFSAEQIKAIQAQASMAVGAATEVKTLSGLMDTLKEGVASGWSQTFRIMVGDFEQAKTLFTGISNSVGGWLGGIADARNELLKGWMDSSMGGRDDLLEGLRLAAMALLKPLQAVGSAFRSVFPATTVNDLRQATLQFRNFALSIQPSTETLDKIRRTAAGFFAVLGIGWEIIKAAAKAIFDLFGSVGEGSGSFLSITASIGDFLVALLEAIRAGDVFGKIFGAIATVIKIPIEAIKILIGWIGSLFDTGATVSGDGLKEELSSVGEAADRMRVIFERVADGVRAFGQKIGDAVNTVKEWFQNLFEVFQGNGWEFNADTIMKALGIGAGVGFGALLLKGLSGIKNAIANFDIFGSGNGGFFDKISDTLTGVQDALNGLTDALGAMTANLKASALLKIAAAIGILAVSIFLLAGIDTEGLIRATAALTVMFIQLGAAMKVFATIGTTAQMVKLTVMGFALMFLATAILILTAAVRKLSELDWNELAKGLIGVTVLLGALAGAVQLMAGKTSQMIRAGAGLLLLAFAVKVLVSAVEDLSGLGWEELAKGLIGVGVLLAGLTLFARFAGADSGGIKQGAGILLLAVAIKVLASAVGDFAQYNWEQLARGMAAIAVSMGLIIGALWLMPKSSMVDAAAFFILASALGMIAKAVGEFVKYNWEQLARGMSAMAVGLGLIVLALRLLPAGTLLSAAAIFVVAASLGMIADALGKMATLSWAELAEGLVGMAAALGIIAIALNLMSGTLAGAAALIITAAALAILLPVLQGLAAMGIANLALGIGALAAVFVVLGVAGLLLTPFLPILLALGIGIGLLGVGVFLAAAGVLLFSTALTALAASGAAGAAAFKTILTTLLDLIPYALTKIGEGIIAFAQVIIDGTPKVVEAFVAIVNGFLQAIIDITPKIGETMLALLITLLNVITTAIPTIVQAGMDLLLGFLRGIANNIGRVVTTAVDIIVNFLNGIANNLGRIITSGANLVIKFMEGLAREVPRVVDAAFKMIIDIVNGIANAIRQNSGALFDAGWNIVDAIIDGIIDGVSGLAGKAIQKVKDLAGDLLDGAMSFLGINSPSREFRDKVGAHIPTGIAVGIDKYAHVAKRSTVAMGGTLLNEMGKTIAGLSDKIGGMDEFNPVITPVLDLSSVRAGSSKIGDILGAAPIDLREAMASAGDASAGYSANLEALNELAMAGAGVTQNFTQINNSPKALSSIDIYRNTNNQISQAKGALTNAN